MPGVYFQLKSQHEYFCEQMNGVGEIFLPVKTRHSASSREIKLESREPGTNLRFNNI